MQAMLSPHFTKAEFCKTDTGLENEPCPSEISNLIDLCFEVLEPVKVLLSDHSEKETKLKITSGYRSYEVNKAVGGAKNSQHCNGQAADIVPLGMRLTVAYELIRKSDLPYDQLILEPGWIHISHSKIKNRRQAWVK